MNIRQLISRSVLASVLGGCFDEGGELAQQQAAETTADGLLAFPDISDNATTDATTAGDALAKFLKTPVAADQLLSPPFQLRPGAEIASRIAQHPADLPGCIATTGPTGCDMLAATDCAAGAFSFDGTGSRTCAGCPGQGDVLGACTYDWSMTVGFSDPNIGTLAATTTGSVTRDVDTFTGTLTFMPFELTDPTNHVIASGAIKVCTCGALTVSAGPPRRLVNSQFVVKDIAGPRCAVVSFDSAGTPSTTLACACPDNSTCAD